MGGMKTEVELGIFKLFYPLKQISLQTALGRNEDRTHALSAVRNWEYQILYGLECCFNW